MACVVHTCGEKIFKSRARCSKCPAESAAYGVQRSQHILVRKGRFALFGPRPVRPTGHCSIMMDCLEHELEGVQLVPDNFAADLDIPHQCRQLPVLEEVEQEGIKLHVTVVKLENRQNLRVQIQPRPQSGTQLPHRPKEIPVSRKGDKY